jgi:hypothetical protein
VRCICSQHGRIIPAPERRVKQPRGYGRRAPR